MAHSERPALDRILRQPRMREAFDLLTDELSGSDLTSLLLEVFRRRAEKLTPADVVRRSRRDRFVRGVAVPFEWLRRVEDGKRLRRRLGHPIFSRHVAEPGTINTWTSLSCVQPGRSRPRRWCTTAW